MRISEDPMLLWALVGSLSGLVLAIAGTGGGGISIPILMTVGGYGIKQASGYGLLVLSVGAAVSWLMQRKHTQYPIVVILIVCASLVAIISAPLKAIVPSWAVILLLNATFAFSLYSLWVLRKYDDPGEELPFLYRFKTASVGGAITGFLSTMTGLGGGVIIIPWLTGITRLGFDQALACSLLTVAITAPFSAWRQGTISLTREEWIAMIIGMITSGLLVRRIVKKFSFSSLIVLRKVTLTGVIFISMLRTLWELF